MYKKIMFLIITLSIIINVENSTVVMAKENIVTEIVDFPVTINYEEYNVDDYNANDMMLCEYPMVVYKNKITVPGYTGHGQKRGALFTVNGEYIYTVHSDHKKYAPCKIKIDTGEIIYTDGEN